MESVMTSIRKNPGLYMTEGILLIILGVIAFIMPIITTITLGYILGAVLVVGGIFRFFRAIKLKHELKHFWLSLLSAIVAAIIGVLFLTNILAGIYLLTIGLAVYFFVDGMALITQSMYAHTDVNWGWLLFSGMITIILSVLIISNLPYSAAWIPGLLLALNLIITGISLTYIAANANAPMEYKT